MMKLFPGSGKIFGYLTSFPWASHYESSFRLALKLIHGFLLNLLVRIDGPQSDDLLKPVFMGCATKNAKVVAISLGSLQRLIALKAVPQSAVPLIINTMTVAMSQGVDIQLRILQTLVSLVPNFPEIHGNLLGDVRPSNSKLNPITHLFLQFRRYYYVSNFKNLASLWYHLRLPLLFDSLSCL